MQSWSTRHPRKDKGAVSGFKKYIYFLSLWIVLECTRGLYHAEIKVAASQQPLWVNEQGRRVPPNGGKRRDAFVSICFLLSHRDSNSTELPQEGLRMYLVFDHTSSDRGGHYFCFHVTFLFCLWFFLNLIFLLLLFQLPALKKMEPEPAWRASHSVKKRCCHSTQNKTNSAVESNSTGAELVIAFSRSLQCTASQYLSATAQQKCVL